MPSKQTSIEPPKPGRPRQSSSERRAAEIAAGAGKQAQLKQEAADRRAERARRDEEAARK